MDRFFFNVVLIAVFGQLGLVVGLFSGQVEFGNNSWILWVVIPVILVLVALVSFCQERDE